MNTLKSWYATLQVRSKLILIFICISLFPFTLIGYSFYGRSASLLQSQSRESDLEYIGQSMQNLDASVKVYDNLSDYLAFNQVIAQALVREYDSAYDMYESFSTVIDPFLSSIQYFHTEIGQVTIFADFLQVEHNTFLAPLEKARETFWYDQVQEDTRIHWLYDAASRQMISVRTIPLLARMNRQAVLYIAVDAQSLFAPFVSTSMQDYYVDVYNDQNDLLFSAWNFKEPHPYASYTNRQDFTSVLNTRKDVQVNVSDYSGWKVRFLHAGYETSTRLFFSALMAVVSIVALLCAAVYVLDRAVSSSIARPLDALSKQMEQVANGNLERMVPASTAKDEIGSISRSFQAMTSQLHSLIDQIYVTRLKEKEYQLKALQHQINPHFLYNTLSLINFKALEVGEQDISRMTLALSSFYRTCLNKGRDICALKEECANILSYLEIQNMMHDNSFRSLVYIQPGLEDVRVPNLIIQPMVENAIEHGLDEIQDGREPWLAIYIAVHQNRLRIYIHDNGQGMSDEKAKGLLDQSSSGYGMRNVHERIQLFYGPDYGLRIHSAPGRGSVVVIEIPYRH